MSLLLVRKLLRDYRTGLIAVCVLLCAFEFLWCKVTQQSVQFMRELDQHIPMVSISDLMTRQETGKLMQKMIGGENVTFGMGLDSLTIGYVHPLALTILCVWALGRAAGAVAGELDRGTMELLLAQPLARSRVITSHFAVDLLTIPAVCLAMWAGTVAGSYAFDLPGLTAHDANGMRVVRPWAFAKALPSVASLLFAVSGVTVLLSSLGRYRTRVLGVAVLLMLVQFLVNLLGQMWSAIEPLRPFTVFYYYQPQAILLDAAGAREQLVRNVATLAGVGLAGYAGALVVFARRDLPAPL
jgi:ABC-2 type transport system permease protein